MSETITVAAAHLAPVYLDAQATVDKALHLYPQSSGRGRATGGLSGILRARVPYLAGDFRTDLYARPVQTVRRTIHSCAGSGNP